MRAHALLQTSAFDPDALKVITTAFDAAWSEIAPSAEDAAQIERLRMRLAYTILAIADEGMTDSEELKRWALEVMQIIVFRKRSKNETAGG